MSRFGSARDLSLETRSRLSATSTSATTPKKEEKGPPITFNTRYKVSSTRSRSRDPSPVAENGAPLTALQRLTAQRDSRDPSPLGKGLAVTRLSSARSRDPSPVASYTVDLPSLNRNYRDSILNPTTSKSNITTTREKSRDPSPTYTRRLSGASIATSGESSPRDNKYLSSLSSYRISNSRERSRDPSPSITLNSRSSREASPAELISKYATPPTFYSNTVDRLASKLPSPLPIKTPEISVSYMASSERPSRISFINRNSPQKESPQSQSRSMIPLKASSPRVESPRVESPRTPEKAPTPRKTSESDSDSSDSDDSSSESSSEEEKPPEAKIMIQVTTITRGTSPTASGGSGSARVRRIEVAKTIERVRERPLQGPPTAEKSTQSDRMDDSTRYTRFGSMAATYNPYSPNPTNYSSSRSSSRYSRDDTSSATASDKSSSTTTKSDSSKRKEEETARTNATLSERVRASQSKTPDSVRASHSKTPESIRASQSKTPDSAKLSLPQSPQSPKPSPPKVSNKDFRKSALNMGPTDRVSRSKSSSSDNSSPTVEKTRMQFQQLMNAESKNTAPVERSQSVDSESSTESAEVESQIEQKSNELTKKEIISHKIEEAKSFLLKTLGSSTAVNAMKSPSPKLEATATDNSLSVPGWLQSQKSQSSVLDFSHLQNWWAADESQESPTDETERQTTTDDILMDDTSTLQTETTLQTTMQTHNTNDSKKWSWLDEKPVALNANLLKLERAASGEKAWWCTSPENKTTTDNLAMAQNGESTRHMWEQETQADISEIQHDEEFRESDFRTSQFNHKPDDASSTTLGKIDNK